MNLAEQIRNEIGETYVKRSWHQHLKDYLIKSFKENGNDYIYVHGSYGREWCEDISDTFSFSVESVKDFLEREGFKIINTNTYGSGGNQFVIVIHL